MKRCTQTHNAPGFGEIPEGSIWADDSPYIGAAGCFEDVTDATPATRKKPAVRKFGQPVEAHDGD